MNPTRFFGHTAVRITDTEHFIDIVYNYGAFDFNTPNFVAKFIKETYNILQ
jgi:hypothetical protein